MKLVAVAALAALACGTQVLAQGTPRYAEGQLLILFAPDYPAEAAKARESGSVTVTGKVRIDGSLGEPVIASTPANAAMEEEVRAVTRFWRFQPKLDAVDCRFRETQARVTIYFDADKEKPTVSFSRATAAEDPALMEQLRQSAGAVVTRANAEYPWHVARNSNAPPFVQQVAYARVQPDGSVGAVSVAPKRYYDDYREAVVDAAKKWRFQPRPSPWCAEMPFDFRLN